MSLGQIQRSFTRVLPIFLQQNPVQRAIRVDHAGEYAAVRIYEGQMDAVEGRPVWSMFKSMQDQEKEHLRAMERLSAKHGVQPTILTPLYNIVGYALGYSTAWFGNKTAMACTVAVEELIAKHYNDQIKELIEEDPASNAGLLEILSKLRDDELEHHDVAVANYGLEAPLFQGIKWVIQTGCKTAIFVSKRI